MATLIRTAIPGNVAPANYLVRLTTSFAWNNRTQSPIQVGYKPGEVDRPLGVDIQLAVPVNTLRLDCELQPNPFVMVWFRPKLLILRPARCHVTVIAVFKRTQRDENSVSIENLRQRLVLYGVVEHLVRQGIIPGDRDPRYNTNRQAWYRDILPRTSLKVWQVSSADIDRMQPASGFSRANPGGATLITRSKNMNESGFVVGTPACR